MHILYLHQYFTTPEISGGTRSYTFAKKLIEKGHKVTMITSNAKIQKKYDVGNKIITKINIDGIDIVGIKVNYSQKMKYISRIISFLIFMFFSSMYLIKKRKYDLVFATSTPLTIAVPGLIAKYRNKIPFVFEVRDLWPEYAEDFGIIKNKFLIKITEKFCKFVYNKANHIVAISNSMMNRIINKYNISSKKMTVIPIGSWNYLKKDLNDNRVKNYIKKFNLKNKFIIGYAGTLGYTNNMDSIINIGKALKDYKDIVIAVAGDGKDKNRLEKEIINNNLYNIKLLGRFNQNEIVNIIDIFDVCYISEMEYDKYGKKLMNAEDALSNKFFDYILMGKPILINAEGEITKLMEKYNFGVYINDRDGRNIKDIILQLKKDKELRKFMGKNSLQVSEIYDRDKMALRLENLFKEVL